MKQLSKLLLIVLCLLPTSLLKSQESHPVITKFFKLVIGSQNKSEYVMPDSLLNDTKLSAFATNMWAFNVYLYANYAVESKKYMLLDSLLADTTKLKSEHNKLLMNDLKFQNIFYTIYNRKMVPSIHIDTIQRIMSRFFYLHRRKNDKIVLHMCGTINEVMKMEQNEYSPFYNSFCYMVLVDQNPFSRIKSEITYELAQDTDNQKLDELKNKNYDVLSKHQILRQMIIDEYELKKDYLNFKIIY